MNSLRSVILFASLLLALVQRPASGAEAVTNVDALLNQAAEAFDKGKRDEAFVLCTKASEADPKSLRPYYVRGRFYAMDRQHEKAVADFDAVLKLNADAAMAYQYRGEERFKLGRFQEAVADFDKYIELVPNNAPNHWQRGIACYYAGQYRAGRRQFELHQLVNPDDVENAVWHYLCMARTDGVEKARAALMKIGEDRRVPMMQIYALFAGKGTAQEVLDAAKTGEPSAVELNQRLFYANLYLGLYYEATDDQKRSREHILKAADEHKVEHFMGDVARAHAAVLRKQKQ
jgi:lipoprotein NlpI